MIQVIKKDGTIVPYDEQKIIKACSLSASRALDNLTDSDYSDICVRVWELIEEEDFEDGLITVAEMHAIVEKTLMELFPNTGEHYRQYRNYKNDFIIMLDDVYTESQKIMYLGDKDNANTDSALVTTKRSLIFNKLNRELYRKFFMNKDELQACNDGYIYIHDQSARRDTMNCFRRDTNFITKDGIKSFYDFSDGDETMVISHKGIWRKAIVHKYGWQPIQKVTLKKGARHKGTDIYCTKNHRWIKKNGENTTDLQIGDMLISVPDITIFEWDSLSMEHKKLWCKGFAKGDGSLIGNRRNIENINYMIVRLCGEKIRYSNRFLDCGYNVKDIPNSNDKLVHMLDTNTKEIPFLSIDYTTVKYYINGLMCADGNRSFLGKENIPKNPSSEFRGIQVTGDLNNHIYDLLNMSGYYVISKKDLTGQETNYGVREKETISYHTSSTQMGNGQWRVSNIENSTLNPKAEVWCLEVEEDNSFLLEYGIPTGNCCIADIETILTDGFEMANIWYNEPKSLDVAFDVIGDIVLSMASCQYGGFTIPEVDKLLKKYAELSYDKYVEKYISLGLSEQLANNTAWKDLEKEMEQGYQGWEYKFNTVASSRGDYPFLSVTFGLGIDKFEKLCSKTILKVRRDGQGKKGFKKPVLFPKLIFLYTKELHGEGMLNEDLFEEGVITSSKTMYPDWLSLDGDNTLGHMYQKYGKVISPMGKCKSAHVKRSQTIA